MNTGSILSSPKVKAMREAFAPILHAMKGGAAAILPRGGSNNLSNVPLGQQLIETFVIVFVLSVSMQLIDRSIDALKRYQSMAVDVFPLTYYQPMIFEQDATSGKPILEPSKDERSGSEYSYSCFVSVSPETFTGEPGDALKHLYHKGSRDVYPLMAPGVFFHASKNTLRVYQNSTTAWNNYVDVHNFPMRKWVHLVVVLRGRALEVYVNGNMANRIKFPDLPKLNFGCLYLFKGSVINYKKTDQCSPEVQALNKATEEAAQSAYGGDSSMLGKMGLGDVGRELGSTMARLNQAEGKISIEMGKDTAVEGLENIIHPFKVVGAAKGYISRMKYFAFALSYSQIDKLMKEGPNPTQHRPEIGPMTQAPVVRIGWLEVPNPFAMDKNLPGYQVDDWWTMTNHMVVGPQ